MRELEIGTHRHGWAEVSCGRDDARSFPWVSRAYVVRARTIEDVVGRILGTSSQGHEVADFAMLLEARTEETGEGCRRTAA